jgi:hypothetical protein
VPPVTSMLYRAVYCPPVSITEATLMRSVYSKLSICPRRCPPNARSHGAAGPAAAPASHLPQVKASTGPPEYRAGGVGISACDPRLNFSSSNPSAPDPTKHAPRSRLTMNQHLRPRPRLDASTPNTKTVSRLGLACPKSMRIYLRGPGHVKIVSVIHPLTGNAWFCDFNTPTYWCP